MAEDDQFTVDFEQVFSWIPTHVLEDCDEVDDHHLEEASKTLKNQNHQRNDRKMQSIELASPLLKSSSKPQLHQRSKHHTSWGAAGGPGMQAIFLNSGQKSCGTGVFLPRTAGADFHFTNKPVCSPVLLPARVVQALKLNVHELGLQIKPPGISNNSKSINSIINSNNKKGSEVTSKTCVISQDYQRNSSQPADIFLPREWTY